MAKPVRRTRRVAAGACLALPVVALLCVPWYARSTPRLAGVEFFYWYQCAWIPGSVVCMLVAYLLLHGRRRRPHNR